MQIILGLLPFIAFALLTRVTAVAVSLWIATAIATALIVRSRLSGASIKILEVGAVALFGLLALYTTLTGGDWSIALVRIVVDSGLTAIVLLSILIRQPFTLQYAREQAPPEVQGSAGFLRVNYVLSAVWALALAICVLADIAMEYAPGVPRWLDIAILVAALVGAMRFTQWYLDQVRKQFADRASAA